VHVWFYLRNRRGGKSHRTRAVVRSSSRDPLRPRSRACLVLDARTGDPRVGLLRSDSASRSAPSGYAIASLAGSGGSMRGGHRGDVVRVRDRPHRLRGNAFAFAYDLQGNRMMLESHGPRPRGVARSATLHQQGEVARFGMGGTKLSAIRRGSTLDSAYEWVTSSSMPPRRADGPPAITAIARLGDGLVNGTEKRALLAVAAAREWASARSRSTRGPPDTTTARALARHTQWRWRSRSASHGPESRSAQRGAGLRRRGRVRGVPR